MVSSFALAIWASLGSFADLDRDGRPAPVPTPAPAPAPANASARPTEFVKAALICFKLRVLNTTQSPPARLARASRAGEDGRSARPRRIIVVLRIVIFIL